MSVLDQVKKIITNLLDKIKTNRVAFLLAFLLVGLVMYQLSQSFSTFKDGENAEAVFGVAKKFKTNKDWKNMSADDCKNIAEESDGKYIAWGHHNEDHEDDDLKNTCYMYTKLKPFKGDKDNEVSMMSCADASMSVLDGCKPQKVKDDGSDDEESDDEESDDEDSGAGGLDDLLNSL